MAFLAFPDCIQAEVRFFTLAGGDAEVTFWYRKTTGSVTQADVDTVASTIDSFVASEFLPLMGPLWEYRETFARDMTAQISFQATDFTSAGPGTRAGVLSPACVAVEVSRESGLIGRSARGRVFLPFGTASDYLSIVAWGSSFIASCVAACEDIDQGVIFAGAYLPIIASRKLMASTGQVLLSTFEIEQWRAPVSTFAVVRGRLRPS